MTQENASQYLPFVKALAEGKLQVNNSTKENPVWENTDIAGFNLAPENYRIKPDLIVVYLIQHKSGKIASLPYTNKTCAEYDARECEGKVLKFVQVTD